MSRPEMQHLFHNFYSLWFGTFVKFSSLFCKFPLKIRKNYDIIASCEVTFVLEARVNVGGFPMDALKLIITILQLLCGLAIIVAVLFQSGKSAGLSGSIGGVADSFLAKNKAKTLDAKLARATKWVGAAFLILTLLLSIVL